MNCTTLSLSFWLPVLQLTMNIPASVPGVTWFLTMLAPQSPFFYVTAIGFPRNKGRGIVGVETGSLCLTSPFFQLSSCRTFAATSRILSRGLVATIRPRTSSRFFLVPRETCRFIFSSAQPFHIWLQPYENPIEWFHISRFATSTYSNG